MDEFSITDFFVLVWNDTRVLGLSANNKGTAKYVNITYNKNIYNQLYR